MNLKWLIVLFFFALSYVSWAQGREGKGYSLNNLTLNNENHMLLYKFSFPDSELVWSKFFIANKKLSVTYCKKDSSSFINSLQSDYWHRKWTKSNNEISFKDSVNNISELFATIYGSNSYPVYVFYGDSVLKYSYLENNRSDWISDRKLTVTLGEQNSIIGVISGSNGNAYVLFNSEDENGQNSVLKVRTTDNGYNWVGSDVAIKHNSNELKAWCVASRPENPKISYILLSDKQKIPYFSHTEDGGHTWSYPKKIASRMAGDSYKMTINKGTVFMTFRSFENGEIMLWHGSLVDLASEQKRGTLVMVTDRIPELKGVDFSVEDIAYYRKRHYYALIKSSIDGVTYLQIHLIRRTNY